MADRPVAGVRRRRARFGCGAAVLLLVVGVIAGWVMDGEVAGVIAGAWTRCYDTGGGGTYAALEMADSPRMTLIYALPYQLAYTLCVPAGFTAGWWLFAVRGRAVAAVAGVVAALVLFAGVGTADLMLNAAATDGMYRVAHCPRGLPSWWPAWLPARHPADPCGAGHACTGAGGADAPAG